jgi:hypothetical protein
MPITQVFQSARRTGAQAMVSIRPIRAVDSPGQPNGKGWIPPEFARFSGAVPAEPTTATNHGVARLQITMETSP